MTNTILSARGEPFKTEKHALNAIKGNDGYRVTEDGKGGFIGIKPNGSNVLCPGCGQVYFRTTSEYTSEKNANPAMIQLKEPWKGWGWDELPHDATMGYGCLVCPDCGSALAPSGKLSVI